MSRTHAALQHRIWDDREFTAQSPDAMFFYSFLLSQPDLTYAGSVHLRPRQWARKLPTMGEDRIRAALCELDGNGFVLVDEETEEVLVRTFVRNDGLWKIPRMLLLAIKQARLIESERLRTAFGAELLRLDFDAVNAKIKPEVLAAGREMSGTPAPRVPPTPHPTPGEGLDEGFSQGLPEGLAQPPGVGTGAGAPVPQGSLGGKVTSHARTREAKPPAPQAPPSQGPPRCVRHADLRPDDPGPPCWACRDVRVESEQRGGNVVELRDRPWCGECGDEVRRQVELPDGRLARCPVCHPLRKREPA